MELRPHTQGAPSSRHSPLKLTHFHVAVSSVAAIAGVVIAAYQTFAPQSGGSQPFNVVVQLDQAKIAAPDNDVVVEKSDAIPSLPTESVELGHNATFGAALKDGSEKRYDFAMLFDGDPKTHLTIAQPDNELNIQMSFSRTVAQTVTAIEYSPPAGIDPALLATTLDVMVLPEGQLEASGRPVMSFTLQQSLESQTFAIPGRAKGKGLWLRIAGPQTAESSIVGDFRILSEGVAP